MLPFYLFSALAILAGPVYVMLHAVSLVIPLYMMLLVIGIGSLALLVWAAQNSDWDEVFGLVMLVVGLACCVLGFALAPLPIKIFGAILFVLKNQFYRSNLKLVRPRAVPVVEFD